MMSDVDFVDSETSDLQNFYDVETPAEQVGQEKTVEKYTEEEQRKRCFAKEQRGGKQQRQNGG